VRSQSQQFESDVSAGQLAQQTEWLWVEDRGTGVQFPAELWNISNSKGNVFGSKPWVQFTAELRSISFSKGYVFGSKPWVQFPAELQFIYFSTSFKSSLANTFGSF